MNNPKDTQSTGSESSNLSTNATGGQLMNSSVGIENMTQPSFNTSNTSNEQSPGMNNVSSVGSNPPPRTTRCQQAQQAAAISTQQQQAPGEDSLSSSTGNYSLNISTIPDWSNSVLAQAADPSQGQSSSSQSRNNTSNGASNPPANMCTTYTPNNFLQRPGPQVSQPLDQLNQSKISSNAGISNYSGNTHLTENEVADFKAPLVNAGPSSNRCQHLEYPSQSSPLSSRLQYTPRPISSGQRQHLGIGSNGSAFRTPGILNQQISGIGSSELQNLNCSQGFPTVPPQALPVAEDYSAFWNTTPPPISFGLRQNLGIDGPRFPTPSILNRRTSGIRSSGQNFSSPCRNSRNMDDRFTTQQGQPVNYVNQNRQQPLGHDQGVQGVSAAMNLERVLANEESRLIMSGIFDSVYRNRLSGLADEIHELIRGALLEFLIQNLVNIIDSLNQQGLWPWKFCECGINRTNNSTFNSTLDQSNRSQNSPPTFASMNEPRQLPNLQNLNASAPPIMRQQRNR